MSSAGEKRALVSGASSGIGQAVAESLLRDGHRVIGLARRAAGMFDGNGEYADNYQGFDIDLASADGLAESLQQLHEYSGAVDAMVLCAGAGRFGSLEEFSSVQIEALLRLNLDSQILLVREFLPEMKRRGSGDIVFVGSESALAGARYGAAYCAGKFGLRGFAQALRQECAGAGVRVSLVNPGPVRSAFFDELKFEPEAGEDYALTPKTVARSIAHILSLPPGAVIEELNMQPLKRAFRSKGRRVED